MPLLNGFETTIAIRQREYGSEVHIPIIAMTAHTVTGFKDSCLSVGMNDCLTKPLEPEALFAAIERLR